MGASYDIPSLPPGWARWTDHVLARLRARRIDDRLLDGRAVNGDPVILVRRAQLLGRRYRSRLAAALRNLVAAAGRGGPTRLTARLHLRRRELLACGPLILTLADEIEEEEGISPRGIILADRLLRDGDSPVYGPLPVSRRYDSSVDGAVRHARAALHLR